VVAQEIKASFNLADEGLARMLRQSERPEHLVHDSHRPPQCAVCGREHQHIVHVAHAEEVRLRERRVEHVQIERPE
jgi:hypothetical protein